jgi:chromosome segregation ATPase
MRDLKRNAHERILDEYKDLEDNVAQLKAELELSQSVLASERSRVERRNEMIRNLKDEIEALKCPQLTMSTTTSSTQAGAQASCSTGPSLHPTAPLPTRAQSGLTSRIS